MERIVKLFAERCAVCGRKIETGRDIVRYGEHFDSEEHAEQYAQRNKEKQAAENEHDHSSCKPRELSLLR